MFRRVIFEVQRENQGKGVFRDGEGVEGSMGVRKRTYLLLKKIRHSDVVRCKDDNPLHCVREL